MKNIIISGARTHNLKNISVEIPKEKISVISGISGSGKSSLAFDTLFAEGQRRYVENLSSYARQVIGIIEKPDVDSIEGIPPAIAIDQKSVSRSPRSTVGTMTETYDFLRLLYARFGEVHCPTCGKIVDSTGPNEIHKRVFEEIENASSPLNLKIFAPAVKEIKGSHTSTLNRYLSSKFKSFRVDGVEYSVEELAGVKLNKNDLHTIEIIVFENLFNEKLSEAEKKQISLSVTKALELAENLIHISINGTEKVFSKRPFCETCKVYFPVIGPRLFSFNSPYGACPTCQGLGIKKVVQPDLVLPNKRLTLAEGAIRPWTRLSGQNGTMMRALSDLAKKMNFSLDMPVEKLSQEQIEAILNGSGDFEGVIQNLERKYRETDSDYLRSEIEQYMEEEVCDLCHGRRLNQYADSVYVFSKKITDLVEMEADRLLEFIEKNRSLIDKSSGAIVDEIIKRLKNLESVGLSYLTLSRSSETLSGGEAQRIRLGVQFDSFLSGVLYVLDEPTISLHSADTVKVIEAFKRMKNEGNTVVVVEHDKKVLEAADYIFDIGPGAGKNGGYLVAEGTPDEIKKNEKSLTGAYMLGRAEVGFKKKKASKATKFLEIKGARHNNLKNIDVKIPLQRFVCVTGVSGGGKSSLVYDILAKSLAKSLNRAEVEPGEHDAILGLENLDKIIKIDQSPIGRTPRSNLATYTGLFTPIRELFAETPESKLKGFSASQYSFNLKGGRCETCRGDGLIKIEMFFMPDAYIPCEECGGKRYNRETLEIRYEGKTIADTLAFSVDEAYEFFKANEEIETKLEILRKVGLGYLPLGQSATTISGGEAQRIKLATELSKPSTGNTIYILDEPTTGLHFEDIKRLLVVLNELVLRGNTVIVIEHNMDVIKNSDWIIDLGPEGGAKGGQIVAEGTPDQVAANKNSLTGQFLADELST